MTEVAPSAPAGTPAPPPTAAPATTPDVQPIAPTPTSVRSRSGGLLNVVLAVAVALAISGVAFAVGRFSAPTAAAGGRFGDGGPGQVFNGNGDGKGGPVQGGPGFLAGGGVTLEGTVESITDSTLTLKTTSGQTIQIALDGTTTYHAQSDASASDVKADATVLVRLTLRRANGNGGGNGGNGATNGAGNPTASDVTVVP